LAVVKALLLPPGILLLVLAVGLVIARRRRSGVAIAAAGTIVLYAVSTSAVGELGLTALTGLAQKAPANRQPGAIVVLGADFEPGGPPGVGEMTLARLRRGAVLHADTGVPVLVAAGPVDPISTPGARLMAEDLRAVFDTPVRWMETDSHNTWTNAAYSADILHAAGIQTVHLVTHPWHMARARRAFAANGLSVTPAPTHAGDGARLRVRSFLPSASGLRASYLAAHEAMGLLWYALRYDMAL